MAKHFILQHLQLLLKFKKIQKHLPLNTLCNGIKPGTKATLCFLRPWKLLSEKLGKLDDMHQAGNENHINAIINISCVWLNV